MVVQPELFGPACQGGIGLRPTDENDLVMSKQVVVDLEVFVDRYLALIVIEKTNLHLFGGITIQPASRTVPYTITEDASFPQMSRVR